MGYSRSLTCERTANTEKIDWKVIAADLGIPNKEAPTAPAARMRFTRLKAKLEKESTDSDDDTAPTGAAGSPDKVVGKKRKASAMSGAKSAKVSVPVKQEDSDETNTAAAVENADADTASSATTNAAVIPASTESKAKKPRHKRSNAVGEGSFKQEA